MVAADCEFSGGDIGGRYLRKIGQWWQTVSKVGIVDITAANEQYYGFRTVDLCYGWTRRETWCLN